MEVTDLFSHKIHSSGDDWPNKLIDIASIFYEFDGKPYDRAAIEKRLSEISPRSSVVARDPAKLRDEISAYPAYLGLYRIELLNDVWHIFLSNSAKQFLVTEEPNVAAFMLLQMTLFQYPNGMGVAYTSGSNGVRIQSNTRKRTLGFIENNIHLSPFRLICVGLKADSNLRNLSLFEARLSIEEAFVLANQVKTNGVAKPSVDDAENVLNAFRKGQILAPKKYESRFHILKHTNLLISDHEGIRVRDVLNQTDAEELQSKFDAVISIETQFNGFDDATISDDLLNEIRLCNWGRYFDGVRTLKADIVNILTNENPAIFSELEATKKDQHKGAEVIKSENIYQLRQVDFSSATDIHNSKSPSEKFMCLNKVFSPSDELTRG